MTMILKVGIASLTQFLDELVQNKQQSISSNEIPKGNALRFIHNLFEKASLNEFKSFVANSNENHLLGYLMKVLCDLVRHERSDKIKILALQIMAIVLNNLMELHSKCLDIGKNMAFMWLPGVTSALLKVIMSDTKLPKVLFSLAFQSLTTIILLPFSDIDKYDIPIDKKQLEEASEQLALRINVLSDYILNNNESMSINNDVLSFCQELVKKADPILIVIPLLKPIIRLTAFINSQEDADYCSTCSEIFLHIKSSIMNKSNDSDLDFLISTYLIETCERLEDFTTMLPSEKISELRMMVGYLALLPADHLTSLFEVETRKTQLLTLLISMSELDVKQSLLFLTDSKIEEMALEKCQNNIYTTEKQYVHISEKELRLVKECCVLIGSGVDFAILQSTIKMIAVCDSKPSEVLITGFILEGAINNSTVTFQQVAILTDFYIHYARRTCNYIKVAEANQIDIISTRSILTVVICIESLIALCKLQYQSASNKAEQLFFLRVCLCEIIISAADHHRPVAESSMNTLFEISKLYSYKSIRELVECNIDYIIDGAMRKIQTYIGNEDITEVIAVTFRLSSVDNFYYFKNIYNQVFEALEKHYCDKPKPLVMLLHRTVLALVDRKQLDHDLRVEDILKDQVFLNKIRYDIDINIKIKDLERRLIERNTSNEVDATENTVLDEIKAMKSTKDIPEYLQSSNPDGEVTEENSTYHIPKDIELTKNILNHCIHLISSNCSDTRVLALKTASCCFNLLRNYSDILLPLAHLIWSPLYNRLVDNYRENLEVSLSAFECLVSLSCNAKDFIKKRTLQTIIPRLCSFLNSSASISSNQKDYGPYAMTLDYKCQVKILLEIGKIAYNIQVAYYSLWTLIEVCILYLDEKQPRQLREAALESLNWILLRDPYCVYYYVNETENKNIRDLLPLELFFDLN